MRSSKAFSILLVTGVTIVLLSTAASATVMNQTTTTLLFDDGGFEAQPADQTSHIAYVDGRGGLLSARPVNGPAGTWSFAGDDNYTDLQVTDHIGDGDPGAAEGDKYLRIRRSLYVSFHCMENFAAQTTAGNQIHLEQMLYVAAGSGLGVQLIGWGEDGTTPRINLFNDGSTLYGYSQGTMTPISNGFAKGKWQKWELDYAIGGSTFDLTINGVKASGLATHTAGGLAGFDFVQEIVGGALYLDAAPIPEPGTIALLLSASVGLLAYAWRKRK